MTVHLTNCELATVLAALRHWQQNLASNKNQGPISPDHFDDQTSPLTIKEIDDLCERINR